MPPNDEELFQRFADGDNLAFDELIRRRFSELSCYAQRLGLNEADAEDIVQEVCCKLFRQRNSLKLRVKVRTYLYTLTRNASIDMFRKGKVRVNWKNKMMEDAASRKDARQEVYDPEQEEKLESATSALALLPDEQKQAVVLVVLQGMDYSDAAEILQVAKGTVKSRVHYALKKIRKAVSDLSR